MGGSWAGAPPSSGTREQGLAAATLEGGLARNPLPWPHVSGRLSPWAPQPVRSWGINPPLGMPTRWLSTLFLATSRDGHSLLGKPLLSAGNNSSEGTGTLRGVFALTLVVPSAHLLAQATSSSPG